MALTDKDAILRKAVETDLKENRSIKLCVTGASMRPYLSGNGTEHIILSQHKQDELKPGAIILFLHNDRYVFHRIVKIQDEVLIVQGDGNYIQTEMVKPDEVLGIVRYIIRKQGDKVPTDTLSTAIYWRIWYFSRPLRRYLLFIYNRFNK